MKRILVVNPICSTEFDEKDRSILSKAAPPGFEVYVMSLEYGPQTIESYYDDMLASPFVVKSILEGEKKGYNAAMINCFMDPGLKAAREVASIPVVGAGESAVMTAILIGDSFGIVDVGPEPISKNTPPPFIRELGLASRFAGIKGTGIPVHALLHDKGKVMSSLKEAANSLLRNGADVIVLGCTGLIGMAKELSEEIGVPVVDPAISALNMVVALVNMDLRQSRRSYMTPPPKIRKLPEGLDLKI